MICSSPQTTSINRNFCSSNGFLLRTAPSQLFSTLPGFFYSVVAYATIYTFLGNKFFESTIGSTHNITLPINGLANGTYLLEAKDGNTRIAQPFNIAR